MPLGLGIGELVEMEWVFSFRCSCAVYCTLLACPVARAQGDVEYGSGA